jgi:hypothetical protein
LALALLSAALAHPTRIGRYPGFPLTETPDEYRRLLFEGLGITYLVNTAVALYARGIAVAKEEPVGFWMAKCFLFGGLALGELAQAVPEPLPEKERRGAGGSARRR